MPSIIKTIKNKLSLKKTNETYKTHHHNFDISEPQLQYHTNKSMTHFVDVQRKTTLNESNGNGRPRNRSSSNVNPKPRNSLLLDSPRSRTKSMSYVPGYSNNGQHRKLRRNTHQNPYYYYSGDDIPPVPPLPQRELFRKQFNIGPPRVSFIFVFLNHIFC